MYLGLRVRSENQGPSINASADPVRRDLIPLSVAAEVKSPIAPDTQFQIAFFDSSLEESYAGVEDEHSPHHNKYARSVSAAVAKSKKLSVG